MTSGGGVQISGGPGGLTVNPTGMQTQPRYRLNLAVNIQNLFNHPVYSGFSGAMNSQFFLQPTRADGVRRITFNTTDEFLRAARWQGVRTGEPASDEHHEIIHRITGSTGSASFSAASSAVC